ncbi:hypothetical protein LSM04_001366 [Trypanosoma melophagium]|uniref:uncharacterized protein n=1 Tax=Trypanosoma melophagium TaxID=715481 RepID=UPI00351A44B7|nr:hypothetical protein LSM04_001366 [Trypanosoma melophagium]
MCGICCILSLRSQQIPSDVALCDKGVVERVFLSSAVRRRGPDFCGSLQFDIDIPNNTSMHVEAMSSVLSLRGKGKNGIVPQPAVVTSIDEKVTDSCVSTLSSFLQWNGEVFGGSLQLSLDASDTAIILNSLRELELKCSAGIQKKENITNMDITLAQSSFAESCVHFFEKMVEGPYAFVYYAKSLQMFLYGRDPLGRRSLLTHMAAVNPGGHMVEFVISSVAADHLLTTCENGESSLKGKKRGRHDCHDWDKCSDAADELGGDGNNNNNNNNKLSRDNDRDITTPSVGSSGCWQEVPITGLFGLSVVPSSSTTFPSHYPWKISQGIHPLLRFQSRKELVPVINEDTPEIIRRLLDESDLIPHPLIRQSTSFDKMAAIKYLQALWKAVSVRVKAEHCGGDITRPVGVLFSGGIDCTMLAAIAHYVLPIATPIELINVAFGDSPELTPDRMATFRALNQLLQLPQLEEEEKYKNGEKESSGNASSHHEREWRLVLVDVPHHTNISNVQRLIFPGDSVIDLSIGTALWYASQGHGRMQRIYLNQDLRNELRAKASSSGRHKLYRLYTDEAKSYNPDMDLSSMDSKTSEDISKFTPLLDAIIAEVEAFASEPSTPILLSTLGKDHAAALRAVLAQHGYKKLGQYLNDASAAGLIAFARRDEAPSKAVRLVRSEDMDKVRCDAPTRWFHVDGEKSPLGLCVNDYTCESRILLLGMGADETLGGYTRHRRAFERRGAHGLAQELDYDFARLWKRNLGRDDRVVCDSGREGRYPYLDEGVLASLDTIATEAYQRAVANTTNNINTTNKSTNSNTTTMKEIDGDAALQQALGPVCCFTAEGGQPGVGDKKILRYCAAMLGLGDVVRLQKRAIQFGSRVAHPPS